MSQTLKDAEAAYRAASAVAEQAREARNAAVRDALADGQTHAQVARETGLTRGRIGQMAAHTPNARSTD